jgi:hypothetical protein
MARSADRSKRNPPVHGPSDGLADKSAGNSHLQSKEGQTAKPTITKTKRNATAKTKAQNTKAKKEPNMNHAKATAICLTGAIFFHQNPAKPNDRQRDDLYRQGLSKYQNDLKDFPNWEVTNGFQPYGGTNPPLENIDGQKPNRTNNDDEN